MKSPSPKKRIGIISICHESNTFIPEPTTVRHYEDSILLRGETIAERYRDAHHEIGGFLEVLNKAGMEAVPIIFAHTAPWGKVADTTLQTFWKWIEDDLRQRGPWDGILAAPHGAAVNESHSDMDGWWLTRLRQEVGDSVPIIATMDPHANLSAAMVRACDALISYRENPHLDQRQRGVEAATLMVRTLAGEIRPIAAGAFPPLAINIERQLTSSEPMLSVQRELDRVRELPGVLSASVTMGFPYADIADMGAAFVVVTDNDRILAQRLADNLAAWLLENAEQFRGEMISPEEALARVDSSPKPVGLLDMGDNMGGGAPGDSTVLAHLCLKSDRWRTLLCVPDAQNVQACLKAGVGAKLTLKIGGKLPMSPAEPLEVPVSVISIHDGFFTETKPRHGGKISSNMGPCVVVKTDRNMTILLMTLRIGVSASAQPFIACGLDPQDYDIIIIKGVHAPVGGYAEVCPTLIRVNTPGVTSADLTTLTYRNRRQPLFPFEACSKLS